MIDRLKTQENLEIKNFMIREGLYTLNQIDYEPVGTTLIDKVARGKLDNLQIKVNAPPNYEDINWRYNERKDTLTQLLSKHLFLLYTDIHGAESRLSRINEWYENNCPTKVNDIYCLGDMVGDHFYNQKFDGSKKYIDDMEQFKAISIWDKTLKVLGNHDVLFTSGSNKTSGQRETVEDILSSIDGLKPAGANRFVHYNAQACRKKYLGVDDDQNYLNNSYGVTFGVQNDGNCCYYFKDYEESTWITDNIVLAFNTTKGQYIFYDSTLQTIQPISWGTYSRALSNGKPVLTLNDDETAQSIRSKRYSASGTFTIMYEIQGIEQKFYVPELALFTDSIAGESQFDSQDPEGTSSDNEGGGQGDTQFVNTESDTSNSEPDADDTSDSSSESQSEENDTSGISFIAEWNWQSNIIVEYKGKKQTGLGKLRVIVLDDFHYTFNEVNLTWNYSQGIDYSDSNNVPSTQHEWFRWCLYDALQQGCHVLIMQHCTPTRHLEPLNNQYPFSTKCPAYYTDAYGYYTRLQTLNECLFFGVYF